MKNGNFKNFSELIHAGKFYIVRTDENRNKNKYIFWDNSFLIFFVSCHNVINFSLCLFLSVYIFLYTCVCECAHMCVREFVRLCVCRGGGAFVCIFNYLQIITYICNIPLYKYLLKNTTYNINTNFDAHWACTVKLLMSVISK